MRKYNEMINLQNKKKYELKPVTYGDELFDLNAIVKIEYSLFDTFANIWSVQLCYGRRFRQPITNHTQRSNYCQQTAKIRFFHRHIGAQRVLRIV